jgi:DNA polymerase-3 subunit alpha
MHPAPRLGKQAKFMVITDCPNWSEAQAGKMLEGKASENLKLAIKSAGLTFNEGYYTSLVKSAKPKGTKRLTTEQIKGCTGYLLREIELLKPPVIVALGGAVIRHFVPDAKGGADELAGKVIFNVALDANIVLGFNPMMIAFDPDKMALLTDIFRKVAAMVA